MQRQTIILARDSNRNKMNTGFEIAYSFGSMFTVYLGNIPTEINAQKKMYLFQVIFVAIKNNTSNKRRVECDCRGNV